MGRIGWVLIVVTLFASDVRAGQPALSSGQPELPSAIYEEWRTQPYPMDGDVVAVNPVALQWRSEVHWTGKPVVYDVYLSRDPQFSSGETQVSKGQRWCFYNPHKKLTPGTWYWKYEIAGKEGRTSMGPFSFVIPEDAYVFETPTIEEFLARIPMTHPLVMNQGRDMRLIREKAPAHPLYREVVQNGHRVLKQTIYRGPLSSDDPAQDKAISKIWGKEVGRYHTLLEAYVLSGDKALLDALLMRTQVMLAWPTHDLLGSQVLGALSMGYDILYDELPVDVRRSMLEVIDRQISRGLKSWPGKIEGRQVENHFWQTELSSNFQAALATVHDLDNSNKMLEYTYELFIARFPNLSTQEGGWAEGPGYFGVNKSAIVDMALLMKRVGGADVFKMPWYLNLPDYYIYFAPANGPISGFGDMHDRVPNGNIGQSMMMVAGVENQDEKAQYRLFQTTADSDYTATVDGGIRRCEPWYQIVNDLRFTPASVSTPSLPQSKVFYGVGLAALHSDVLRSDRNTSVFFRSSPFGAKGHMHANQNCFNIARKGERVFYSTGYYTSFSDPHSLTSYRHTWAHNGILIDGCGQAFGHEGYGWIKRFLDNDEIGYVCGDATMAYRPTVDPQFLGMNAASGIRNTPEWGFGDAQLKLFERHVAFLRPNVVVVYDVLESEVPHQWTLMLHTPYEPEQSSDGRLSLMTPTNAADVRVYGSSGLNPSLTDKFRSPAIDFKKKYDSVPDWYHVSYASRERSASMRFLTILCLGDRGAAVGSPTRLDEETWSVAGYTITASLHTENPAAMSIRSDKSALFVGAAVPEAIRQTLPVSRRSESISVLVSENGQPVVETNRYPFNIEQK